MFRENFLIGKICNCNLKNFSNSSKDSKLFHETNKNFIGEMKDEFGRAIVVEFVELKPKMHSMENVDGKECNTAKGVSIMDSKMFYLMKTLLETK